MRHMARLCELDPFRTRDMLEEFLHHIICRAVEPSVSDQRRHRDFVQFADYVEFFQRSGNIELARTVPRTKVRRLLERD